MCDFTFTKYCEIMPASRDSIDAAVKYERVGCVYDPFYRAAAPGDKVLHYGV